MGVSTSMTKLLNKIERRLGTSVLNLPKHLQKNKWAEVIETDTLDTFSRFFPHKILYKIDVFNDKGKDGYYYIDEDKVGGDIEIYGVRDLALESFAKSNTSIGDGYYNIYNRSYGFEDILLAQMSADIYSGYDNGIYIDFEFPNKIAIKNSVNNNLIGNSGFIDIYLLVKHSASLATISPTKMEEFEKLALLDVKIFLYEGLKHFDQLETVYANIDLKINDWASADNEREALVEKYKDVYVSASNFNQPIMYTI